MGTVQGQCRSRRNATAKCTGKRLKVDVSLKISRRARDLFKVAAWQRKALHDLT